MHRLALVIFVLATAAAAQENGPAHWVASWAAAPIARPESKPDAFEMTRREIIHTSLGGSQVRITLSNKLGADPLTIGGANIALSRGGSSVDEASLHAITFAGKPTATIAPGATVQSDPVDLAVPANRNLAVSLYLPAQRVSQSIVHPISVQTNYWIAGNHLNDATLASATEAIPWLFLTRVDVLAPANTATIVALGDSITDGFRSTVDANHRYPNFLFDRLQANPATANFSVTDVGISAGRVLHDRVGPSALHRFDSDVLAQPNVKYLILLEGINDIGFAMHPQDPEDKVNAGQIIAGLTELIDRAHAHGIKIYGATLIPFRALKDQTPEDEGTRQAVNKFIRTSGKYDAVIDFDKALADPANPRIINPALDRGDHVHPNDDGYKAMADAIDLSLFTK